MIYTQKMGRKRLDKERADITLPRGMKKQLQDIVEADGKTLSELFADLARDYLRGLSLPLATRGRPRKKA